MQFSSFSKSQEGSTITLYNEIPIENVGKIKYYTDDSPTLGFSKKEFRWSFNNEYWSAWQTLTQKDFTYIDTHGNYYLFLQIRYIGSSTVSKFTVNYEVGNESATTPRILVEDIKARDASAVVIHDILQSYETITLADASLLNGESGSYYLDRNHHTGKQAISTITGLQAKIDELEARLNALEG